MRELRSSQHIDRAPSLMIFATAALNVQAYCICAFSVVHAAGAARRGSGISMARGLFGHERHTAASVESVWGHFPCDDPSIME